MVKYGTINNKIIIEMAFTDNNMEKFTYNFFNNKGLYNMQINILQQNSKQDSSINENLNECAAAAATQQLGGNNLENNYITIEDLNQHLILGGTSSISKVLQNRKEALEYKREQKEKTKQPPPAQPTKPSQPPQPPQQPDDNTQLLTTEKFLQNHNTNKNIQYKIQLIIPNNNNDLYIIEPENNSRYETSYKKYKEHILEQIDMFQKKQKLCNPILLKSKKNNDFEIEIGEIVQFLYTKIETSPKYKGTQINKIADNII